MKYSRFTFTRYTVSNSPKVARAKLLIVITSFFHIRNLWWRGAVVITTAQLHSTKAELRFCAGSNPTRGVSEIRNSEDLWKWLRLEIRLNAFRRSTIPQKQFIIIFIITSKFSNFKNHVQTITNLLEFKFRCSKFFLLVQTKKDFYELWIQHKLLKTKEMNEAGPDIFIERHQF